MLDRGGRLVYDPLQLRCWTPAQWRAEVFAPAEFDPRRRCVTLCSDDPARPGRRWYHTRGLRKFGRPDVGVYGVPDEFRAGAVELCQRLIGLQADGMVVPDGHAIRTAALPDGLVARLAGDADDPDYNNAHLAIRF